MHQIKNENETRAHLDVRPGPDGHATERRTVLAAHVENLNRRGVKDRAVFASNGDRVGRVAVDHTEGSTECQVADDVEGESVEPVERFNDRPALERVASAVGGGGLGGAFADSVPLAQESLDGVVDVRLEFANGLRSEGVRDDLALPGVLGAVPRVK